MSLFVRVFCVGLFVSEFVPVLCLFVFLFLFCVCLSCVCRLCVCI